MYTFDKNSTFIPFLNKEIIRQNPITSIKKKTFNFFHRFQLNFVYNTDKDTIYRYVHHYVCNYFYTRIII